MYIKKRKEKGEPLRSLARIFGHWRTHDSEPRRNGRWWRKADAASRPGDLDSIGKAGSSLLWLVGPETLPLQRIIPPRFPYLPGVLRIPRLVSVGVCKEKFAQTRPFRLSGCLVHFSARDVFFFFFPSPLKSRQRSIRCWSRQPNALYLPPTSPIHVPSHTAPYRTIIAPG